MYGYKKTMIFLGYHCINYSTLSLFSTRIQKCSKKLLTKFPRKAEIVEITPENNTFMS